MYLFYFKQSLVNRTLAWDFSGITILAKRIYLSSWLTTEIFFILNLFGGILKFRVFCIFSEFPQFHFAYIVNMPNFIPCIQQMRPFHIFLEYAPCKSSQRFTNFCIFGQTAQFHFVYSAKVHSLILCISWRSTFSLWRHQINLRQLTIALNRYSLKNSMNVCSLTQDQQGKRKNT